MKSTINDSIQNYIAETRLFTANTAASFIAEPPPLGANAAATSYCSNRSKINYYLVASFHFYCVSISSP